MLTHVRGHVRVVPDYLNSTIYNIPERLAIYIRYDQKNKNSHLNANCLKCSDFKIYIMIPCKIDEKEGFRNRLKCLIEFTSYKSYKMMPKRF